MTERVIVKQDRNFNIQIWGTDPRNPESDELIEITSLADFTPYTMMLAGMGSCVGVVVHTFAQNHGLDLETAEFRETYVRAYKQDGGGQDYDEHIEEEMTFTGDLGSREQEKLFRISHQCPIHKMYQNGLEIHSRQVERTLAPV